MLFNLDFANNTILSCFFFLFLFIDLLTYTYTCTSVITQFFYPIAELLNPIRAPNKEAKTETEIHPIVVEATIRKCSI